MNMNRKGVEYDMNMNRKGVEVLSISKGVVSTQ